MGYCCIGGPVWLEEQLGSEGELNTLLSTAFGVGERSEKVISAHGYIYNPTNMNNFLYLVDPASIVCFS